MLWRLAAVPCKAISRPRLHGAALRVTIFIGECYSFHHKPIYSEIVHRAHHSGLAGASVFKGTEDFDVSSACSDQPSE